MSSIKKGVYRIINVKTGLYLTWPEDEDNIKLKELVDGSERQKWRVGVVVGMTLNSYATIPIDNPVWLGLPPSTTPDLGDNVIASKDWSTGSAPRWSFEAVKSLVVRMAYIHPFDKAELVMDVSDDNTSVVFLEKKTEDKESQEWLFVKAD